MPRLTSSRKHIIKKTVGRKSPSRLSAKGKKRLAGTFQNQARREKIAGGAWPEGKGGVLCGSCGAVYFEKHWHSPAFAAQMDRPAMAMGTCEECHLGSLSDGGKVIGFGGELVLAGLSDARVKAEVLALARNVGRRAQARDPEDRIIKINDAPGGAVVTTTENQLAVSIGKQIDRARKGGKLDITWSQGDKPVRVRWTAPEGS